MDKKILIAVDGSLASNNAVDYVGLMEYSVIKNLYVTLFYVMNPIPAHLRREGHKDTVAFKRLRKLQDANTAEARTVMENATRRLKKAGLTEEQIEIKIIPRTADAARDILFEAEQGMYDAVVLGRRGLSKAQEMLMGSVTNKIVQHADRVPVWVVGGKVESVKVLCCVDGSDGSLKAVDHMAFLLGGNQECEITLFHVTARLADYCPLDFGQEIAQEIEGDIMESDEKCMHDFYARAQKVLEQGGVLPQHITTKEQTSALGVIGAILAEIKNGGYGTVVLGRTGEDKSFFLGHVGDKVMTKGGGSVAVWLVG